MPDKRLVEGHYTHGRLTDAIRDGVLKMGKSIEQVRVEDLGPVDEFHIGGRLATDAFLDQLQIDSTHHVLDVGCGLGGGSRRAAQKYGCRMTGVDLTREYVETGRTLCEWVGLADQIRLDVEDASALPYSAAEFDRAYIMHVGMNIADKQSLASELYRVLRPGGKLGIYDIMQIGDGDLDFPVPWATSAQGSSLATPAVYRSALEAAGFKVVAERNRSEFALEFFKQLRAKIAGSGGPPPLGLHILMGESAPTKIKNMVENIARGVIAPVELIAEKAA